MKTYKIRHKKSQEYCLIAFEISLINEANASVFNSRTAAEHRLKSKFESDKNNSYDCKFEIEDFEIIEYNSTIENIHPIIESKIHNWDYRYTPTPSEYMFQPNAINLENILSEFTKDEDKKYFSLEQENRYKTYYKIMNADEYFKYLSKTTEFLSGKIMEYSNCSVNAQFHIYKNKIVFLHSLTGPAYIDYLNNGEVKEYFYLYGLCINKTEFDFILDKRNSIKEKEVLKNEIL